MRVWFRILHQRPGESREGDGDGVVQAPFSAFLPDCLSGVRTSIAPASTDGAEGADVGADIGPKLELRVRVEQWSPTFWYQGPVS